MANSAACHTNNESLYPIGTSVNTVASHFLLKCLMPFPASTPVLASIVCLLKNDQRRWKETVMLVNRAVTLTAHNVCTLTFPSVGSSRLYFLISFT